jgi:hypothetical protein
LLAGFLGKTEAKTKLGKFRNRREGKIKFELRNREWEGADWIYLPQKKVPWKADVKTVLTLQVP